MIFDDHHSLKGTTSNTPNALNIEFNATMRKKRSPTKFPLKSTDPEVKESGK